jgi:hypothetical protein
MQMHVGLVRFRLVTFLLCLGLLVGCAGQSGAGAPASLEQISVAEELQDFYESHGGAETLGPPIQAPRRLGGLIHQAMLNVELVYNPEAPAASRVSLEPLGWRLGLAEPAASPQADLEKQYFLSTGHTLDERFLWTYESIGGESIAGAAISEAKSGNGRTYQCFENLALYQEEEPASSPIRLMALGLAAYPEGAQTLPEGFSAALPPTLHSRPFGRFLDRIGGEALLGPPLTEPFIAQDGFLEQVYERAALYAPNYDLSQVRLRPLGALLGAAEPAVAPGEEGLFFAETGHNVSLAFAAFYDALPGDNLLGLPMEEAHLEGERMVQRFENAVVEYRYDLPAHLAIQLSPLGIYYLATLPADVLSSSPQLPTTTAPTLSGGLSVSIEIQVEYPILPPGEQQHLTIRILLSDGTPWVGVVPLLIVHGPGADFYPDAPATDSTGTSSLTVEIPGLRPGEIVNIEVAVAGIYGMGYAMAQYAATGGP